MLADPLEAAPLAPSKHSQMSKAESCSSAHTLVTFEGVSGEQAPGSESCAFDDWEVAKCIFKNFIHPIDAACIVSEGNLQRRKDAILSIIQVSILPLLLIQLSLFGNLLSG